jgi:hypothetical protein
MTTLADQSESTAVPSNQSKNVDHEADQLKRIRISNIRGYDRNPRRQRNPE